MKYLALFVILKKRQNLKLSSAANYRWRFMGLTLWSADNLCKQFGQNVGPVLDLNCLTL